MRHFLYYLTENSVMLRTYFGVVFVEKEEVFMNRKEGSLWQRGVANISS